MYQNQAPIILASASPRREEFLRWMGLSYSIEVADIDESQTENERPEAFVLRLAREKGEIIASRFPDCYVISGDTVVCLGTEILGKPENRSEAVAMLMRLSGQTHTVFSAYSVICRNRQLSRADLVQTEVTFTGFSEQLARAYVETGEPMDKAGAYGIQQRGVALVKSIRGSYSNVVGLPLPQLLAVLTELEVISPRLNPG